ncbi:MAG: ABC transporter substrate-binding protein [Acidimicrobiales bacterium]
MPDPRPRLILTAILLVLVPVLASCGSEQAGPSDGAGRPVTLRLGYFPNVTHATAVAGIEKGIYAQKLGSDKLSVQTFNAGPAAVEAIFADGLDAAYVGANPAINAFSKSNGEAIRIIAGATSGGASLVVKPSISQPADLRGKRIASPQLGGTQDVALRAWLADKGLKPDTRAGASVLPQDNAQTLETFRTGEIEGAWVPEPWATRLVQEAGGKVLIDERSLWPNGQFVTTQLVVRTKFLKAHPATVRRLIEAQVAANDFVNQSPEEAQRLTNQGMEKITGKRLPEAVMEGAWKNLTFTNDPVAASLTESASDAERVGLLEKVDLQGIYDLSILDEVLKAAAQQPAHS